MTRRARLLAALVTSSLLVAGCGDDDGGVAEPGEQVSTSTVEPPPTSVTTSTAVPEPAVGLDFTVGWEQVDEAADAANPNPPFVENVAFGVLSSAYVGSGATSVDGGVCCGPPRQTDLRLSVDGSSWQQVTLDFGLSTVAAGGPGLLATGLAPDSEEPAIWSSADGIDWERWPDDRLPSLTTCDFDDPDRSCGLSVWSNAHGVTLLGETDDGLAWWSVDGDDLTLIPGSLPELTSEESSPIVTPITPTADGWIFVNRNSFTSGTVWASDDGQTWVERSELPGWPIVFTYLGDTLVGAGQGGWVGISEDDGRTWDLTELSGAIAQDAVDTADGIVLLTIVNTFGTSTTHLYRRTDTGDWTETAVEDVPPLGSIANLDGTLIAGGVPGEVWRWTPPDD